MNLLCSPRNPDSPYPKLREVFRIFVAEVGAELAKNLIGIYLVGSLASSDFNLGSDVDFFSCHNSIF
jgi:predicted nucleotidyltransferase